MVTNSSTTSSGLEVVCIAGDDGGLPQHFVLEVSEARVDPLERRRDDESGEDNEVCVCVIISSIKGVVNEIPFKSDYPQVLSTESAVSKIPF